MDNPLTTHGNSQERMMAMIACIPPLFWVPIVLEKKTAYVAYFMKHGFGLLLVGVTLGLLPMFLGFLTFFLLPFLLFMKVIMVLTFIYLVYHAYREKMVEIPYFTKYLDIVIVSLGIKNWF